MIDATSLARTKTGIEVYTENLVSALIDKLKNQDTLYILLRKEVPEWITEITKDNIFPVLSPVNSQILCEQLWIPLIKLKYKPDIIHFPAFPPSIFIKHDIFFTMHDATMWKFPETLSYKNKLYMKPLSKIALNRAKKVLTVSQTSLDEISKAFPQVSHKIINTGISIKNDFHKVTDRERLNEVKATYHLPDRFLLTVGSIEPRKNLPFLIETYNQFLNDKEENKKIKLVITGRSAWGSKEIKNIIKQYSLENQVIFTGYVPEKELKSLYSLTEYFVFPSIYEGFGLPLLEAMACETPVITSNVSSLPEVAGNAAKYFNPYDKQSLLEVLYECIDNQNLSKDLSKKALLRRGEFSWDLVADKIYKNYQNSSSK
ncbi:glycosyltransferase family 4 protein [Gracilibacillus halophilus]|nr:glycosyltransferase family 1 protein [Gracilibacillus halophilus]